METLVSIAAIVLALGFDFVNGFHDTANAVATVIYTKALKPHIAILLSALLNFSGAVLVGTAVAQVITKIIPQSHVSLELILSVLIGALIWNLVTWWFGLPVSSSHCLIGSLMGAGIASAGIHGVDWHELKKVMIALLISPVCGFVGGATISWIVLSATHSIGKVSQPQFLRWMQVVSSCLVSFTHGSNDGQKTMGIITLLLVMQFPHHGYTLHHVPLWVMIAAATAMGLGTTVGGWRVIRTIGTKITREQIGWAQGFGAEFTAAATIFVASMMGAPISTTHTLTSAVAGSMIPGHGVKQLNQGTIKAILLAWVLTLPAAAVLSAALYYGFSSAWHHREGLARTPRQAPMVWRMTEEQRPPFAVPGQER